MNPDLVNGLFEFIAALFVSLNIARVLKDKEVKGVSWVATAFFTAWGVWNVYFYPSQGLNWSFMGGIFVCLANVIYTSLLIYYSKK